MSKLKATASRGWHGDPNTPEFVKLKLDADAKQQPRPAVFGYRIFRAGGAVDEALVNLGATSPPHLFDEVAFLFAELNKPDTERAEVLFWNSGAAPQTTLQGVPSVARQPAEQYTGPAFDVAGKFVAAVADSLHPAESGSSCQWAVLNVTKG